MSPGLRQIVVVACSLLGASGMVAATSDALPPQLEEVGFDQRLGQALPLDLSFADETGRMVTLGRYFGERPVVLALVFFDCPMLCPMILNGLTTGLKPLPFDPGEEFEVVVVSFDARETPDMAARAKSMHLERYGRPDTADGWHFLTGSEESIAELTEAVGFRFSYMPDVDQFAHAAGIVTLTPEGLVAQYFYGVEYAPKDLRLGLVEAADNQIGTVIDQVLLYCFHYDPATGTYSAVAMNIVRIGAACTVAVIAIFVLIQVRRERRPAVAEA